MQSNRKPDVTRAQVLETFEASNRFSPDEREQFVRTFRVRKARLPDGTWYRSGLSRYAGAGERIHGRSRFSATEPRP